MSRIRRPRPMFALFFLASSAFSLSETHRRPADFAAGILDGKLEVLQEGGLDLGVGRFHHAPKTETFHGLRSPAFAGFLGAQFADRLRPDTAAADLAHGGLPRLGAFRFEPPTGAVFADAGWFEGDLHLLMKPEHAPATAYHLYRLRVKPNGELGAPECVSLAPPGWALTRIAKVEDRLFAVGRAAGENETRLFELRSLGAGMGGWIDFGPTPSVTAPQWGLLSSGDTLLLLSPSSRQAYHARAPLPNEAADWSRTLLRSGTWAEASVGLLHKFESDRDDSALVYNEFYLPETVFLDALALRTEGGESPTFRYRVAQSPDDWFEDWSEPVRGDGAFRIDRPGRVVQYELVQPEGRAPSRVAEVSLEWSLQESPTERRWHVSNSRGFEEVDELEALFRKHWRSWNRESEPEGSARRAAGAVGVGTTKLDGSAADFPLDDLPGRWESGLPTASEAPSGTNTPDPGESSPQPSAPSGPSDSNRDQPALSPSSPTDSNPPPTPPSDRAAPGAISAEPSARESASGPPPAQATSGPPQSPTLPHERSRGDELFERPGSESGGDADGGRGDGRGGDPNASASPNSSGQADRDLNGSHSGPSGERPETSPTSSKSPAGSTEPESSPFANRVSNSPESSTPSPGGAGGEGGAKNSTPDSDGGKSGAAGEAETSLSKNGEGAPVSSALDNAKDANRSRPLSPPKPPSEVEKNGEAQDARPEVESAPDAAAAPAPETRERMDQVLARLLPRHDAGAGEPSPSPSTDPTRADLVAEEESDSGFLASVAQLARKTLVDRPFLLVALLWPLLFLLTELLRRALRDRGWSRDAPPPFLQPSQVNLIDWERATREETAERNRLAAKSVVGDEPRPDLAVAAAGLPNQPAPTARVEWTVADPLPQPMASAGAFYRSGRVYVVDPHGTVCSAKINADGSLKPWYVRMGHLPSKIGAGSVAVLDDRVVCQVGPKLFSAEVDDRGVGPWREAGELEGLSGKTTVVGSGERMLFIGGQGEEGKLPLVRSARIGEHGLEDLENHPALPVGIREAGVAVEEGRVYLVGGRSGNQVSSLVLSAPLDAEGRPGSWRVEAEMPDAMRRPIVQAWKGTLWVIGGRDGRSTKIVAAGRIGRDGALQGWQRVDSDLPEPVTEGAAARAGGRFLLIGGRDARDYAKTLTEVYWLEPRLG